jgi:hypothetical protein
VAGDTDAIAAYARQKEQERSRRQERKAAEALSKMQASQDVDPQIDSGLPLVEHAVPQNDANLARSTPDGKFEEAAITTTAVEIKREVLSPNPAAAPITAPSITLVEAVNVTETTGVQREVPALSIPQLRSAPTLEEAERGREAWLLLRSIELQRQAVALEAQKVELELRMLQFRRLG